MTVGELIKKLSKRDKKEIVYYDDIYGLHEITDVKPYIKRDSKTATIIMNGDGGRYQGGITHE